MFKFFFQWIHSWILLPKKKKKFQILSTSSSYVWKKNTWKLNFLKLLPNHYSITLICCLFFSLSLSPFFHHPLIELEKNVIKINEVAYYRKWQSSQLRYIWMMNLTQSMLMDFFPFFFFWWSIMTTHTQSTLISSSPSLNPGFVYGEQRKKNQSIVAAAVVILLN